MLLQRYAHFFLGLFSLVAFNPFGYQPDSHEVAAPDESTVIQRSRIVRAEVRPHGHQSLAHADDANELVETADRGAVNQLKSRAHTGQNSSELSDRKADLEGWNDCKWTSWSEWEPRSCPVTCGMSKRKKTRVMIQYYRWPGRRCDDPYLHEIEAACGETYCPINCQWNEWLPWTGCTKKCGSGTRKRVRDKHHVALYNGVACSGAAEETAACNVDPCPIDCIVTEWQEWGNCTEECGGGERGRMKEITRPDLHGGKECPATDENGTCNEAACPIKAGARTYAEVSTLAALLLAVFVMRAQSKESSL